MNVLFGYTGISLFVCLCVHLSVCPPVYKKLVSVKELAGALVFFGFFPLSAEMQASLNALGQQLQADIENDNLNLMDT